MAQSSAGESVRELLERSTAIRHSPEIDELIAYSKTPEYAEEKAARKQAAQEAYEAEERARAELMRARREAVAVRVTVGGSMPYADNHDKTSPAMVEAGEVVEVEAWEGDGWKARVDGIRVFVPVRRATPCGAVEEPAQNAETVPDLERKPQESAFPAQFAEHIRSTSEARAKLEESAYKERTKSEPESPWGTRRLLAVMAATAEAKCGGNETRVLLALTRYMADGDETVWRSAEDVCSECHINDKSRQKAMTGLISKGLIQCAQHSHRGSAAEYAVLFPWL